MLQQSLNHTAGAGTAAAAPLDKIRLEQISKPSTSSRLKVTGGIVDMLPTQGGPFLHPKLCNFHILLDFAYLVLVFLTFLQDLM